MRSAEMYGIETVGDPRFAWMPLQVKGILANPEAETSRSIEYALDQEYTPFMDLLGTKSGAVAIVGSGPSLKKNWQELRNFKGDIIACNAACQFLLEKGITPTYMFCFDADKLVLEFFTNPNKDVTYLMASRCVPAAFDMLKGCKVVLWHAAGDEGVQGILERRKLLQPMVIGGSAAVTRAMILAMPMGYKDIHIYGGDSSFAEGDTHIRQSTTKENRMAIKCNGRVFEVAPWMTLQVEDIKKLVPLIKYVGARMHFHGDGLLQRVASELGFRTDYETRAAQMLRLAISFLTVRAKVLWLNL